MEDNQKNEMLNFNRVKSLVLGIEDDANKFFNKGNSAAGTRLRKAMQELKGLAQDVRNDVTSVKNAQ